MGMVTEGELPNSWPTPATSANSVSTAPIAERNSMPADSSAERAEILGGAFEVTSQQGDGTQLEWRVPLGGEPTGADCPAGGAIARYEPARVPPRSRWRSAPPGGARSS